MSRLLDPGGASGVGSRVQLTFTGATTATEDRTLSNELSGDGCPAFIQAYPDAQNYDACKAVFHFAAGKESASASWAWRGRSTMRPARMRLEAPTNGRLLLTDDPEAVQ